MKRTAEIFTENLRRLRKSKFPRQEDFAELVGFASVRGYQKYEQGESSPSPDILDRFAKVLGCEPWQLVAPPPGEITKGMTVADMTPKELEELVSRASKPDGAANMEVASLKKQNSELMEYLPEEFSAGLPKVQDWQIGIARFFLTGNREYLKGVRKDLRDSILAAFRFHKLLPAKAPQK